MNLAHLNKGSLFLALPDEIKIECLSYLPSQDLARKVSLVCKDLCRIAFDDGLWKEKTIQRFGHVEGNTFFATTQNWKTTYIALINLQNKNKRSYLKQSHYEITIPFNEFSDVLPIWKLQ